MRLSLLIAAGMVTLIYFCGGPTILLTSAKRPALLQVVPHPQIIEGLASHYSKGLCRDGSRFTGRSYTLASRCLPRGRRVVVHYNGRSCPATVTDYGPDKWLLKKQGYKNWNRSFDLSGALARKVGMYKVGVDKICVTVVGWDKEYFRKAIKRLDK